jgi:hypothetical protein
LRVCGNENERQQCGGENMDMFFHNELIFRMAMVNSRRPARLASKRI